MIGIDFHELTEFQRDVIKSANDNYPKEARKFIQRAGNALAKSIKAGYSAKTGRKTGNLRRGVKRGPAYKWNGNEWQVRVYNRAPHAHLLEYGHRMIMWRSGKPSKRTPFVKGRHVVGSAAEAFPPVFNKMCEEFVDEFLEKGGF